MPPTQTVDTDVYADHMQFYVVDVGAGYRADLVWDGRGLERHLGVTDGAVAVGTIGYCDVQVRVEVWDDEPPLELEDWDHVVDASLVVHSGRIALESIDGPGSFDPLDVTPGTYRVRSSAAGLDGADEIDGGDRYRIQLWAAPATEPEVRKWWPPWDPAAVSAQPTGPGETLVGAEAHDRRMEMSWLAARSEAHLFQAADGGLWEHSNLADAGGTPQLERLDEAEAERRYGPRAGWNAGVLERPPGRSLLRNAWRTWRYSRGWRPPSDSS